MADSEYQILPCHNNQKPSSKTNLSNSIIRLIFSVSLFALTLIFSLSYQFLDFFPTTHCHVNLINPFLFPAIFLVVSLLALLGIYALIRLNWVYFLYLFLMLLVVLAVFGLAVFVLVVSADGGGRIVSDRGYKEYSLGDYSSWFQKRVGDSETWKRVRGCLVNEGVCHKLAVSNVSRDVFFAMHLSPLESGCCKPSENCGFTYVGPTTWNKTTGTLINADCDAWDNNPNTLCYDCTSCKAGFVQSIKGDWKKVAVVNIVFTVFVLIVYLIGCGAFCHNVRKNTSQLK